MRVIFSLLFQWAVRFVLRSENFSAVWIWVSLLQGLSLGLQVWYLIEFRESRVVSEKTLGSKIRSQTLPKWSLQNQGCRSCTWICFFWSSWKSEFVFWKKVGCLDLISDTWGAFVGIVRVSRTCISWKSTESGRFPARKRAVYKPRK